MVPTGSRASAPVFPPGRYGRRRDPVRRRRRRIATWIIAAAVCTAGVAVAVKLFRQYEQGPYQVTDVATTALTDTSVTVAFDVTLPAGSGAACTVIAQTRAGEQVGNAEISVPAAAQSPTRVTYTLTTSKRAFAANVPGCGPPR